MGTRQLARLIAVAATAIALVLPQGSSAVPFVGRSVQCKGVTTVGQGESVCTVDFEITQRDRRRASDLESHANFHARTAAGTVTIEWRDQLGTLMALIECTAPGLYVEQAMPSGHSVGGGPADLSSYPNCRRDIKPAAQNSVGPQRLTVRARATSCWSNDNSMTRCPFHGYLVLNPPAIPL